MIERIEAGDPEVRTDNHYLDEAVTDAYSDSTYQSLFSRKPATGATESTLDFDAEDVYGKSDSGWERNPTLPTLDSHVRPPFYGDPGIFGPIRQPTNEQFPNLTDERLTPRRGTLPGVNPRIYDPPVDHSMPDHPNQDSNNPRDMPVDPEAKNPEDASPRARDGAASGSLVDASDSSDWPAPEVVADIDSSPVTEVSFADFGGGVDFSTVDQGSGGCAGGGWNSAFDDVCLV